MLTRRRMLAGTAGLVGLAAAAPAVADTSTLSIPTNSRNGTMEIKRIGSQPSSQGSTDYFTGTVRIDPLFEAPDPARVRGASVTFEPGARTAWHTHPLGQTLIVTSGLGLAQRWGGPIDEIRAGRCRLVSARREALARSNAHDGDDACRHSGGAKRQSR